MKPIFNSIANEEVDETARLLQGDPSLINTRDESHRTPLHAASAGGNPALTELLINHGADLDATDSIGWTPLHVATYHGNTQVMELLIDKNCEINQQNLDGWTPLQLALSHGLYRQAKLLRNRGGLVR